MSTNTHLRLVPAPEQESVSAVHVFHRVGRLIPEEQEVLKIPPNMKASKALALMEKREYSQLPVVEGQAVLGLFSYRSFALGIARMGDKAAKAPDLPVDEFLEKPTFASVTDDLETIIGHLNSKDAVLIGHEELLQHIVTPIDALRYLHNATRAFVLLEEIEFSLRELVRMAINEEELGVCIENSLGQLYQPDKLPGRLEDMTLADVVQVIRDGRNWERFQEVFGGTRERVGARLGVLPDLRNDVFHFKREITTSDHGTLTDLRSWLLMKVRAAEARRKGDGHV